MNQIDSLIKLPTAEILDAIKHNPKLLNACDKYGNNLLHLGCLKIRLDLIRELLRLGAKPRTLNDKEYTPLAIAISINYNPKYDRITEELIPENLELKEKNGISIIALLLENGANPNGFVREAGSVFTYAFGRANLKACLLLIKHGVDIRKIDTDMCYGELNYGVDCYGNNITISRLQSDDEIINNAFYYGPHIDMRWERRKDFIITLVGSGFINIKGPFVSNKAMITHLDNIRKIKNKKVEKEENKEEKICRIRREKVFCTDGLKQLIVSFL